MDYSTKEGCESLVSKIVNYWKDRGKEILCWCEPTNNYNWKNKQHYTIKSNLINGLPQ